MGTKLWIDLETYNEVPIQHGSHKYAETAEILLVSWAVGDGKVQVWDRTAEGYCTELLEALRHTDEIWGHNLLNFDAVVLRLQPLFLDHDISKCNLFDTLVQAYEHGLPGSLGELCQIFKIEENGKKEGRSLIQLFCKPGKKGRNTRLTHPEQWAEFIEYARADISACRELHNKMPKWNYPNNPLEVKLCRLDHKINNRGVLMDTEMVNSALELVGSMKGSLDSDMVELTNGELSTATQRDALLEFLKRAHNTFYKDLKASTVEAALNDADTPAPVKELLLVRAQASSTSTAKYKRIYNCVSNDGRCRGLLQFCGAHRTQRWAGRIVQPQNFPRPTMKEAEIEEGIEMLKMGFAQTLYPSPMKLLSNCLRGVIVAPKGKKLVISDLSSIEGRVSAWVCGEHWKLEAIAQGSDMNKLAYAQMFNIGVDEVTSEQRQIGKVAELALGYGGGVGAFVTFALAYNADLGKLADLTQEIVDKELWKDAEGFLKWWESEKRTLYGLTRRQFVACESLKRLWRKANSANTMYRERLLTSWETACASEKPVPCGNVIFDRKDRWMTIKLPSGDCLSYPSPRGDVSYSGMSQMSHKWTRIHSHGGKLLENIVQKLARNVMAHNMFEVEKVGYEIVLTVHDELVTEAPDRVEFNGAKLSELLSKELPWGSGLPLAAVGFESYRYRKG